MITEEKPSLEDALMHFGIKGMKWGKTKERKATDAYNKNVQTTLRNKKFTDKQILAARKRQTDRAAKFQKVIDKNNNNRKPDGLLKWTKAHDDTHADWSDSPDRYTANRKTTGEKRTARLLGGPIGAYRASDFRTVHRVAMENPFKYPTTAKERTKDIAAKTVIGASFVAAVAGGPIIRAVR